MACKRTLAILIKGIHSIVSLGCPGVGSTWLASFYSHVTIVLSANNLKDIRNVINKKETGVDLILTLEVHQIKLSESYTAHL